ncbi:putative phage tail tube protein [Aliivibrio wodanis]|uniref:Putative phage tail tube protein n=1 Tax=Aliivibrio wodanis TaxID=80852 RepID=A0A090KJ19_9GAMM|nr:putative phage tail tube protein [Aliivibrio wodanis]
MAADRIARRLTAVLEGVPWMNEIVEISMPEITFKTQATDGSFLEMEDVTRLNKLTWSVKVRGDRKAISQALGKFMMKPGQFNVTEKGATRQGEKYSEEHSLYTTVTSVKPNPKKMGEKPECTIEGVCEAYKLTDTGSVVHDINGTTGKCLVFGVDLMSEVGI